MVVEQHPTLLNVTLHTSKVGLSTNKSRLKPWQPPWMNGFQSKPIIFTEFGFTANGSKNWRDGLRVYSDATSSVVSQLSTKTITALGALVVLLSVRRVKYTCANY